MEKEETQREKITKLIEDYVLNYIKDEVVLSVSDIRTWPAVDKLCQNHNSANICKAMKQSNVKKEFIAGKEDSTTYTMRFFN